MLVAVAEASDAGAAGAVAAVSGLPEHAAVAATKAIERRVFTVNDSFFIRRYFGYEATSGMLQVGNF